MIVKKINFYPYNNILYTHSKQKITFYSQSISYLVLLFTNTHYKVAVVTIHVLII